MCGLFSVKPKKSETTSKTYSVEYDNEDRTSKEKKKSFFAVKNKPEQEENKNTMEIENEKPKEENQNAFI